MADDWSVISTTPMTEKPANDPWAVTTRAPAPAQPSTWDEIVATVGRPIHDNVIAPLTGMAAGLEHGLAMNPLTGGLQALTALATKGRAGGAPVAQTLNTVVEKPYQASLEAARQTPGYASARVEADKIQALKGSGMTDQMLSSVNPTMAGLFGGGVGGLDAFNAHADAQQAAQDAYASRHPVLSAGANILGGLLMGGMPAPETKAAGSVLHEAVAPLPPQAKAEDYIRSLMAQSKTAPDEAGLQAAQSAANGKPITSAEAIGKPAEVGLGSLARREGTTADALAAQMYGRMDDAPGRILDDFAASSGIDPAAARGDLKALVQRGRIAASPLYDEAYAAAPATTDRLTALATNPKIKQGISHGISVARDLADARGIPFDPNAYAITGFDAAGEPIIGGVPTWRTWDAAKVGLDDMLENYRNPITRVLNLDKRGDAINELRKSLLSQLDAVNPAYKTARAAAADYLSANTAFDNGGKMLLNGNMPVADFQAHFQNLTPGEQQAFMGGSANNLFNLAQNGKLKPALFNRPIVQQKLAVMLGPDQANKFLSALETETRMAGFTRARVPGAGSPTAEYTASMNAQDAPFANHLGEAMQTVVAHGGNVKSALASTVANKAKDIAAAWATRGMPVPVRNEAGAMLMMKPGDLARLLESMKGPRAIAPLTNIPAPLGIPFGLGQLEAQRNRRSF